MPDGNIMPGRDPGWDLDGTANDGAVNWQHALDYVKKLNAENYMGYNDWRLPNKNELRSLAHYGVSNVSSWLNTQGFTNVRSNSYWTSTTYSAGSSSGWSVYMMDGYVYTNTKSSSNMYVWPVRGGNGIAPVPKTGQTTCYNASGQEIFCAGTGQDGELQQGMIWPNPRFATNADTTITDNLTGIAWSSVANTPTIEGHPTCYGGSQKWQDALNYIACLNVNNYLGHNDWRLPNTNELQSIVHGGTTTFTWLGTQGFKNLQSPSWTSDSRSANPSSAIALEHYGRMLTVLKSSYAYVWPVRDADVPPVPRISVTDSVAPDSDYQVPFGNVTPGTTSAQTVIITNSGAADLVLGIVASTDLLAAPFTLSEDSCSGNTIAPRGACTLTIRFTPTARGPFVDSFEIPSNDPDRHTIMIGVSGTGQASDIVVTDSAAPDDDLQVSFGNVALGSEARQTVTIVNSGSVSLILGTIASTDPVAAPFRIASDTCSGKVLAPAGKCELTIRFLPTAAVTMSDSFDIPSDDPRAPSVTVVVNGTGVYAVNPTINISATCQKTSYDANIPQNDDGALQRGVAWPSPRFTDNNDGTITDNLTGLMWLKDMNCMKTNYPWFDVDETPGTGAVCWEHAFDFVKGINNGTYSLCQAGPQDAPYTDWRVPNINELKSLSHAAYQDETCGGSPCKNIFEWLLSQGFQSSSPGTYWSSTTAPTLTFHAWIFSLGYGDMSSKYKLCNGFNTSYVWPVRAGRDDAPAAVPQTGQKGCYAADKAGTKIDCSGTGQDGELRRGAAWPNSRFMVNTDSTLTDNLTGLTWAPNGGTPGTNSCVGGKKTWQGALDYVACLNMSNYLGRADWRLPNMNEFTSLAAAGREGYQSWLNAQGFSNAWYVSYWVSTTLTGFSTYAWPIDPIAGGGYPDSKANSYYVWPVRGGSDQNSVR